MNNYFFSFLCLTILAIAPACKKTTTRANAQEKIKTTIELENDIIETTDDETTTIVKF